MTEASAGGRGARAVAWVRARSPWTAAGWGLVVASSAAVGWGTRRQDRVALAAGITAAVVLLVATVLVALAARRMRRVALPAVAALLEGRPVRTGLSVALPWWLPLVDVTWRWEAPAAEVDAAVEDGGARVEVVTPRRRGEFEALVRTFRVADVLGLVAWDVRREAGPVSVHPNPGALASMPFPVGWARGDALAHPSGPPEGDPYDLRPYVAGDPVRHVLWKVYARNRELVVRTPERAVSPTEDVALWLVAGPGDDAAAAAAQVLVQAAGRRSWTLGADGVPWAADDRGSAEALLMASARTPGEVQGQGLAAFARSAGTGRRMVVLVPARTGPWLDAVVAGLTGWGDRATVLVCADRLRPAPPAPWWARGPRPHDALGEAREVLARLHAAGVPTILVDRQDGRSAAAAAMLPVMGGAA